MGIAQADVLQAPLREALPANTPVAVVEHASLPQQRELLSTLAELPSALRRSRLGSPAVIIIGDVLRGTSALREHRDRALAG